MISNKRTIQCASTDPHRPSSFADTRASPLQGLARVHLDRSLAATVPTVKRRHIDGNT